MEKSKSWSLNWRDVIHGALVAAGAGITTSLLSVINNLQAGVIVDMKQAAISCGIGAIAGFVGYIAKQFPVDNTK